MFQAAISEGVAVRPMPYFVCATQAPLIAMSPMQDTATVQRSRNRACSVVGIRHLATRRNGPGLHGIVVIEGIDAALLEQLREARLNVTGLIGCPALDDRRLALPTPRKAEARQRAREHRL